MPTSGVFNFNITRDEIILLAFQRCGSIEDGDTLTATQTSMAATFLEVLFKSFTNEGIGPRVNFEWVTQTFIDSSAVIEDTNPLNMYKCIYPHTSAAINRPITGPEWPLYWMVDSTVTGVPWLSGTAYTSIGAYAPPAGTFGINQGFLRNMGTDTPVEVWSSDKYSLITDKRIVGPPKALYVDRKAGYIFLYPQPDKTSPNYVLRTQNVLLLEDFSAGTNHADLSRTGLRMLSYGLAYDLSFPLGLPPNERLLIKNEYFEAKRSFIAYDKELNGNERISPGCMVV